MTASSLESRLGAIVGAEHVLTDPGLRASYESDWTGRFVGSARCVVRPGDTAQTSLVVAACAEAAVPVCVQGGNTGLVGASVPIEGSVLLSTRRLAEMESLDAVSAQVTVGAGTTLSVLQGLVRPAGFDVGVDFAARESCTIGGMVATNAGGERVLRYGTMRAQVVGAEAVLASGAVVSRLGGLPKDNTGYDLVSLLTGSEGTLGVLTRLRLRLVPLLSGRAVALVGVADTAAAVALVATVRDRLPALEAAELFFLDGIELVRSVTGLAAPFAASYPAYVLLECAARADPTDELLEALSACEAEILDATVASDARGRAALWAYRESHTEAINAVGVPVKLDVAVPLPALSELVAALPACVEAAAADARAIVFGHVNEGNLHVNLLGVEGEARAEQVSDAVLRLVASFGGSISAEHGVGRAKREWLGLSRSEAEIEAMRAVKQALDPRRILNPGVLLPD